MLKIALEVLKKINLNNYEAYIVGGFSRDKLLNIKSTDIDIATNASPKQLQHIFENAILPKEEYGFVHLLYKNILFEITTYRQEIKYKNRKPVEVEYINCIDMDLLRRDFTINAICIDYKGKYYDPLGGINDLNNKLIRSINDPNKKFIEDPLRILRAIRFATNLSFEIEEETKNSIINNRHLLKDISYFKKKSELNKIFASVNAKMGIQLLLELELDKYLELDNLKDITDFSSTISIWAFLNVVDKYPFTKNEIKVIKRVNKLLNEDILDPYMSFKYGFYATTIAASIKGISKKDIAKVHKNLKIRSKRDIKITGNDIIDILGVRTGFIIERVYDDLVDKIIHNKLNNNKREIKKYIRRNIDLYMDVE